MVYLPPRKLRNLPDNSGVTKEAEQKLFIKYFIFIISQAKVLQNFEKSMTFGTFNIKIKIVKRPKHLKKNCNGRDFGR
jgi:hypothetical protein